MDKRQEPAYKLFNIPNSQIREEVTSIRETASHPSDDHEFQQIVLNKLAELDAKVTRLLQITDKE